MENCPFQLSHALGLFLLIALERNLNTNTIVHDFCFRAMAVSFVIEGMKIGLAYVCNESATTLNLCVTRPLRSKRNQNAQCRGSVTRWPRGCRNSLPITKQNVPALCPIPSEMSSLCRSVGAA